MTKQDITKRKKGEVIKEAQIDGNTSIDIKKIILVIILLLIFFVGCFNLFM